MKELHGCNALTNTWSQQYSFVLAAPHYCWVSIPRKKLYCWLGRFSSTSLATTMCSNCQYGFCSADSSLFASDESGRFLHRLFDQSSTLHYHPTPSDFSVDEQVSLKGPVAPADGNLHIRNRIVQQLPYTSVKVAVLCQKNQTKPKNANQPTPPADFLVIKLENSDPML